MMAKIHTESVKYIVSQFESAGKLDKGHLFWYNILTKEGTKFNAKI